MKNQMILKYIFLLYSIIILLSITDFSFCSDNKLSTSLPSIEYGQKSMYSALNNIPDWNETFDNNQNYKLSATDLSNILWAGQGENRPGRRTTPSAGATYPLDLYVAFYDGITDLSGQIGLYEPGTHSIKSLTAISNKNELSNLNDYPGNIKLILTSTESRTSIRYGDRARQYINLEIGHVLENIRLEAWSRDLLLQIYILDDNSNFLSWVPESSKVEVIICLGRSSATTSYSFNELNQQPKILSITQGMSVESVMEKRVSIREYLQRNISYSELESLVSTSLEPISKAYITNKTVFGSSKTIENSATTMKIVTSNRINNMEHGIYKYNWSTKTLQLLKTGNYLIELTRESLNQEYIANSGFSIVIEMDSSLSSFERKIAMFEAGMIAQRLYHSSYLHGFGMVVIGAFSDYGVSNVVLSGSKTPLYVIPIGPINVDDNFQNVNITPQNIRLLGGYFGYFSLLLFLISAFAQNKLITNKLGLKGTSIHKKIIYLGLALGTLHILFNYGYYFLTKLLTLQVIGEFLLRIVLPPEFIPTNYESIGQLTARISLIMLIITILTFHPKKINNYIVTYIHRSKIHKFLLPIYILLAVTHSYLNSLLFSNRIEFFLLILIGLIIWMGLKIYERRIKDEDVSNSFL